MQGEVADNRVFSREDKELAVEPLAARALGGASDPRSQSCLYLRIMHDILKAA